VYGLKYSCRFDPVADISNVFLIEIFQKGYSGQIFDIIGSTTPALQNWETDDPKAPIKGCSLSMSFINDGSLPLSSFFSTDDDAFKVRLTCLGQVLFEGFLVQDDCSETLVDYTHEINLSANDNLGLLKDVSLDKANIFTLSYSSPAGTIAADFNAREFLFAPDIAPRIQVGYKLRITGTPIDGDYTINKIVYTGPETITGVFVDEPIPQTYIGTGYYQILTPANLLDKTPLITILRMCLSVTGLDLNTNIYGKIIEVSQDAFRSFLEQTLIDPQTFLKSDTEFTDCYDVLEKILSRFNMTLFQSYGVWNIIRWDELRYYNNLIEGFSYDKDFNYIGQVTKTAPLQSGISTSTVAETGILQKICRPYLYDKETFNYQYPKQLLRNFDLKQLGNLIRSYSTGSGDDLKNIKEYVAPWWTLSALNQSVKGEYFIRITEDFLGNEIERTLILLGDVKSYPIEVNQGDSFKYSFSFRTQDSQPGSLSIVCIVELTDGITKRYFHNPDLTSGTMWQSGLGFTYQILSSDNSNQWHNVEIDCARFPIPYDGLLFCYLRVADLSGTIHETLVKDIRLEYTARINETTKIIGQTHQTSQAGVIKNVNENEIFIDSSPRNSIAGTLFLNEKVGLLQKRTSLWKHPYQTQSKKLGDLITFEELFWRQKPRSILEGTLYGAIKIGAYISLLSVIRYDYFPTLNFVFGKLEIDYRNNKAEGTLWEIWEDNERDSDVATQYKFEYLYSTE
jgi:hypothetical protein